MCYLFKRIPHFRHNIVELQQEKQNISDSALITPSSPSPLSAKTS